MNLGFYSSQLTKLYEVMKEYDEYRKSFYDTFDKKLTYLERFKGSAGYEEETAEALKLYNDSLTPVKTTTRGYINHIAKSMSEMMLKMEMPPISDEQMKLLQLASMRKNLSEDELTQLANSVKSNPVALGMVVELAKANNIMKNYKELNPTLTTSDVKNEISYLTNKALDYVESDISKAAEMAQKHNTELYGGTDYFKDELSRREFKKLYPHTQIICDFSTEPKFYESMYNWSPAVCERFKNAIKDE